MRHRRCHAEQQGGRTNPSYARACLTKNGFPMPSFGGCVLCMPSPHANAPLTPPFILHAHTQIHPRNVTKASRSDSVAPTIFQSSPKPSLPKTLWVSGLGSVSKSNCLINTAAGSGANVCVCACLRIGRQCGSSRKTQ